MPLPSGLKNKQTINSSCFNNNSNNKIHNLKIIQDDFRNESPITRGIYKGS